MNTTKILGEAVGIQRQDIIDRTEEQTAEGLTGAVIIGRFKRGRFDAPMEIHQGNIRGQLGYDPKNPDYIAVQDCLDTDVPSVQVLRVKGGDESGNNSSYDLFISPDLQYSVSGVNEIVDGNVILWNIEVDNVLYPQKLGWVGYEPETYVFLEDYLEANQSELGLMAKYEEDEITEKSSLRIYSITNKRKFVRLIPNVPYISRMNLTGNPTAKIDSDGIISFWLEANNEVQIPDPEPEVCNCEASWILIPELTPTSTFNGNDEVFVAVKDVAQSNGMALSNNKPIIEIIEQMMTNVFSNHLEVIRCDSEGTLFRNKTDSCLTLSIWGSIINVSGDKEFFSYLSDKDLCAYDASEVIPDSGEIPCTPTVIPVNNNLMGVNNLVFKYSINGGEIKSHTENTDSSAKIHTVLVNLLAYSPAFLFSYATIYVDNSVAKNFFISYGAPIQGAPSGNGEPMTVEFWATPDVDNCLVTKAFGGDFVLHSCGKIVWTEDKIKYPNDL